MGGFFFVCRETTMRNAASPLLASGQQFLARLVAWAKPLSCGNRFSKHRQARPWRNARFGSFQRCRQISTSADAKGNLRARAVMRMEMAGAAARIDEKRKGGGMDSVTSRRIPWPISTPPPLSPKF
jgi:hypothetical protein